MYSSSSSMRLTSGGQPLSTPSGRPMSRPKTSLVASQRTVPGFTVQSLQKNTKVSFRPPTDVDEGPRMPQKVTTFRKYYHRGDFPLMIEHGGRNNKLAWKTDLKQLDYQYYLPLFFDGLCETRHPYSFLVRQGICDMLDQGGQRILSVLPQLIGPIRKALNTRNGEVVRATLHVLQKMVKSIDGMGEALVPYYRQLLPILNMFKNHNLNTGDRIVYSQMKREYLGDLIQDTLELIESHGGPEAYYHIKYMIPTYESCRIRIKPTRPGTAIA